jgi:hypothetical protein
MKSINQSRRTDLKLQVDLLFYNMLNVGLLSSQHYSFILLALARTDENGLAFLNRAIKDLRRSRDGKFSCVTNRVVLKVRWPFTIIPC